MVLTASQAARAAGLTRQAIYLAIAKGALAVTTIAGKTFVDDIHLKDYVAAEKSKGGRPRTRSAPDDS